MKNQAAWVMIDGIYAATHLITRKDDLDEDDSKSHMKSNGRSSAYINFNDISTECVYFQGVYRHFH